MFLLFLFVMFALRNGVMLFLKSNFFLIARGRVIIVVLFFIGFGRGELLGVNPTTPFFCSVSFVFFCPFLVVAENNSSLFALCLRANYEESPTGMCYFAKNAYLCTFIKPN